MKKIICLLILISFTAGAENVPLPPSIPSVDEMVGEFRNLLTTKIGEMGKNFIPRLSDKTIVFTNNAPMRCNGGWIAQGEPVSSLQYNFKITNQEMVEKSIYTGCLNQVSLVEDVITRGTKLAPLKYGDFIKGKRTFDLTDEEIYKLYRLSNSDNEEIFKLLIEKKGKSKFVELYILGQPFLRLNYEFKETSTRLTLSYIGYKGRYERRFSTWEFNNSFDTFTNTALVTQSAFSVVNFLNTVGQPLSQNEFLSRFEHYATSGPLSRIRRIIEYHNHYFPTTKIVQTGSGNDRLKEELRIAFNRLQNNTELNLVKKQIQEYIEAVENGLLSDSRPKQ